MARAFLRLGERDFWMATPRLLFGMIDEFEQINRVYSYNAAQYMRGAQLEDETDGGTNGGQDDGLAVWDSWG